MTTTPALCAAILTTFTLTTTASTTPTQSMVSALQHSLQSISEAAAFRSFIERPQTGTNPTLYPQADDSGVRDCESPRGALGASDKPRPPATTDLATGIIDFIVELAQHADPLRLLGAAQGWLDFLELSSHGLPPDIILAAFRNRTDYFKIVSRDDALGRAVFERTIRVIITCHSRVRQDWETISGQTPDRRPDMPAFMTRLGGAMVGDRAIAAPAEFRNDQERLQYEEWLAADAEAQRLIERKHNLTIRMRSVENDFRSIARNLFFFSNDQRRQELKEHLTQMTEEGKVDYLQLADLPISPAMNTD